MRSNRWKLYPTTSTWGPELERAKLAQLLDRAMARLTPETRALLVGRYIEQAAHAELTARLGLSAGQNVARLIGPSISGVLMLAVSLPGVVALDAASFFLSGALLALLATPLREPQPAEEAEEATSKPGRASAWREWRDGLRVVTSERWVVALFLVAAISLLGDGIFTALLAPFIGGVLGASALVFGWVLTVRGAGGLAGGLAFGATSGRMKLARLIGPCTLLIGSIQVVMALLPSIPLTLVTMGLGGVAAIFSFVGISTLRRRRRHRADGRRGGRVEHARRDRRHARATRRGRPESARRCYRAPGQPDRRQSGTGRARRRPPRGGATTAVEA
jgi:hypothetical protein